mmetsp:Transcript_50237/g.99900  ORF Transcript_50237/g.99900 Transcript_50237/m.99900 type:complete len:103 (+) Transcript_50237:253-561(+)
MVLRAECQSLWRAVDHLWRGGSPHAEGPGWKHDAMVSPPAADACQGTTEGVAASQLGDVGSRGCVDCPWNYQVLKCLCKNLGKQPQKLRQHLMSDMHGLIIV